MNVTLLNIELPQRDEWGILQINNFNNTYFRFEFNKDGKPNLDTCYFADQLQDPKEKHQPLRKDSELYIAVQQLLEDYFTNNPVHK